MIHAADVREWRNRDVVDTESRKIVVLEAVYLDTTSDEPAMAPVRTGLPYRAGAAGERQLARRWVQTTNKPQTVGLGFQSGAGDENRTRALSLGS